LGKFVRYIIKTNRLVPPEPKTEFYETYEEYETAMLRWLVTCLKLPFLPPHPAQFQKLVGKI
jgi:hypothetical protein